MIKEWIDKQAEFQADDTLGKQGMSEAHIWHAIAYIVNNGYLIHYGYDEYDFDRWLRNSNATYYASKKAFGIEQLEAREERIPAGVSVNWDETADFFLTDVYHVEFDDGGLFTWSD